MDDISYSIQGNRCPRNKDAIRTQNATIEEIRIIRDIGYVTISYGAMGEYNRFHKELISLVVTGETIILDSYGNYLSLINLREGMFVDVEFSSAMTRSIPPQTKAFRIFVINMNSESLITEGRVLTVDFRNRLLYTGDANDMLSQMRYVITDTTLILDRDGNEIPLRNIRPDQWVRVEHAIYQTLSIPPQTTAFVVQIR